MGMDCEKLIYDLVLPTDDSILQLNIIYCHINILRITFIGLGDWGYT